MYSLRASNPFGYMPVNSQYGRVVEGNIDNSYGPWIDPELQRMPHRRSMINMRRRKHMFNQQY